jgi:hypothetical protein
MTSREINNGKSLSKRSQNVPRDDKKTIKALVMTNETLTTKIENNEKQE